tara:strand:- start:5303 stop:5713 length:411 start_codon:yes stop_codon:yes gene_type:complete
MRRIISPPGHSLPVGEYSPGVCIDIQCGDRLLFISGQVASDETGAVVGEGDATKQTQFVFGKIESVLTEAGGTLKDLVSLVIYVTDLVHFAKISKVRDKVLAGISPSSTFLEVSSLVVPEHVVEISGVALLNTDCR